LGVYATTGTANAKSNDEGKLAQHHCHATTIAADATSHTAIAVQDYGLQMGLIGPRRQKTDLEVASLSSPDREVGRDGRRLERESAQKRRPPRRRHCRQNIVASARMRRVMR